MSEKEAEMGFSYVPETKRAADAPTSEKEVFQEPNETGSSSGLGWPWRSAMRDKAGQENVC